MGGQGESLGGDRTSGCLKTRGQTIAVKAGLQRVEEGKKSPN